jgi:hypothetical protein
MMSNDRGHDYIDEPKGSFSASSTCFTPLGSPKKSVRARESKEKEKVAQSR